MDRENLLQAIEHGPVRVTLNDGALFDVESLRDVAVDQTVCYLMHRNKETERYKAVWLSLVCMTKVVQLEVANG